jgi:3-dehydroquinate dehydratase-2
LYGRESLEDVRKLCERTAAELGLRLEFRQTNCEGTLIDYIQEARARAQAIIINPAAYAHTSIAVHDALLACDLPVYVVHITNTLRRESFRHVDYAAMAARGQISGCGTNGYALALRQVARVLGKR